MPARGEAWTAVRKNLGLGTLIVPPILLLPVTVFLAWAYASGPRDREELVWMTGHLERWGVFHDINTGDVNELRLGPAVLTIHLAEYRTPLRARSPIANNERIDQFMQEAAKGDLVRFAVGRADARRLEAERDVRDLLPNPQAPITVWSLATPRAIYLYLTDVQEDRRASHRKLLIVPAFIFVCDLVWVEQLIHARRRDPGNAKSLGGPHGGTV